MLRFLTQKLRAQSLNEVLPFDPKTKAEEDVDYNTDSEEENQEVEQLLHVEDKRMCNGLSCMSSGPAAMPPHPVRSRPLEDIVNSTDNILSSERDRHSSEEELAALEKQATPEKRKWSQISRGKNGDLSASSDEEVRELCVKPAPLKFSASPPTHLQKLTKKHSDGKASQFVANVGPAGDFASPRKRHRHAYMYHADEQHAQNGRCLDFEKMQQKQYSKKFHCHGHGHNLSHTHGVRVGRLVRVKGISWTNSRLAPRLLCDPAVFSFRSLSTVNPLTPVEDSSALAAY